MARMTKKAREQLATHLGAQSHERLVELVAELAEGDAELRNRLLLEAASAGTGPVDAASYRRSFSDALVGQCGTPGRAAHLGRLG